MPIELRVHGVSGTPPSALLYTDPVTYDQGWDLAKVYERNRDDWDVRAYHWGSLTSRSSLSAFWLLLAPFAMANVAGWMSEAPNVWSRIWIRVAGLALTGIFFAQAANMALDIPYATGTSPTALIWLFAGACVALVLAIGILSTQSTFKPIPLRERFGYLFGPSIDSMNPMRKEPDWGDPAQGAQLVGFGMWTLHSIVHRLRRLHLTFGMAVLALVAARTVGSALVETAAILVAGVIMVVLACTAGFTASNRLVLRLTALAPLAGVGLLTWAIVALANRDLVAVNVADDVTYQIALILGLAAGLGLVGELLTGGMRRGWVPMGLLTIAALVGATLGLTGSMLVENFLSDAPDTSSTFDPGASFVTVGMLGLVVVVATAIAIAMYLPSKTITESRLRRAVLRARAVLTTAAVYGAGVGALAAYLSCSGDREGCSQANIPLPDWVMESEDSIVVVAGLPFDPTSLLGWAKLLMVAVPAALILRSIIGGLLNGEESRRQVGILWDLGSFWPRWLHPLAPPAYGPYAVTRMQTVVSEIEPDVVTAHSQGSLVAAAAISLVDSDITPTLFITYGSQLGLLYPTLFPAVGFPDLVASTDEQMSGRWLNLWRASDPIGGHVIETLGSRNWGVEAGSGHARYELTPEFCAARRTLDSLRFDRPPTEEMANCWET